MMNKMLTRAVVLGMTAVTLLTGVPATPVMAAEAAPISTSVKTSGKGDKLKITYKVNMASADVTDGRVAVEYDPNVLELKKDSEGIRFSEADVNREYENGDAKGVAYAFINDAPKTVSGTLMTVQFTVKAGLQNQDTTIATKVFGVNNEATEVLASTELEDTLTVGKPLLAKPEIKGIKNTVTGVYLNWTRDNNADGYIVYRSTSKNGKYSRLANVGKLTGYWDILVANKKTYYYKVVSYTGRGNNRVYSEESDPVSIRVKKFFGIFG